MISSALGTRAKGRGQQASRIDVVFIRKSSPSQDVSGQIANVEKMLRAMDLTVPKQHWFVCTVKRAKVQGNSEFQQLIELVRERRVGTVYIESQDRWGTGHVRELFTLLNFLAEHGTALYDLRDKVDLTEEDDSTEIQAFFGSMKSKKERKDLSWRSLRTRVANFQQSGTWPTGTHPFGYGKQCYSPDGKLLWEWQPISRSRGQLFLPNKSGKLVAGPENVRIPAKTKLDKGTSTRDKTVLVPSNNKAFVETVRLVFELYTKVGLSRRKISERLNKEGRTFYSKPFTYPYVTQILTNPAYVGDTHFGKTKTGEHYTFDREGNLQPLKRSVGYSAREEAERLIKQNTHKGLIDRATWQRAQEKLASEQARTSYSPRNPAYYLKQIFVCGHCGKNLTGRTDTNRNTGTKKVSYVCSSYVSSKINGQESKCGFHSISHDDAEQLLLNKIKELGVHWSESTSELATGNLESRLARLGQADEESLAKWQRYLRDGIRAFADYLNETFPDIEDYREFQRLKKLAIYHYLQEGEDGYSFARLPIKSFKELREAIQKAEAAVVEKASSRVESLKEEHAILTRTWMRATERQQQVMNEDIERLEQQIAEWEPRTVALSERFEALYAVERQTRAEREQLLAEWPTLQARERGEALRRVFKMVRLFWDSTFIKAREKPDRPRKTNRPGRFSYQVNHARIEWELATTDLMGSS